MVIFNVMWMAAPSLGLKYNIVWSFCDFDCNWNSSRLSDQFVFFHLFLFGSSTEIDSMLRTTLYAQSHVNFKRISSNGMIVKSTDIIYLILIAYVCVSMLSRNHSSIYSFIHSTKMYFEWINLITRTQSRLLQRLPQLNVLD